MGMNFVILLFVIGLVILFGWLTHRAWRAGNPFVKWIGAALGSLLTLVALFVSVLGVIGLYRYYNPPYNPVKEIQVEGIPEQIARGQHLAAAFCVECHSVTNEFPLTGGVDVGEDLPMKLGSYYSANLTPAGRLSEWTDGEIFRALRDNVDKDGRRLVGMAGTNVRNISDEDLHAVIAFLRSQQPVEKENPFPHDQPNFLAILIAGSNMVPDKPLITEPIVAPQKAATAEYGEFMVSFLDCKTCHGEDLHGGDSPIGVKGPSLRLVKAWTEEEFITTLRTGVNPSGRELSPLMPWKSTGRLDDVELSALYQYLISLE
ncbi:MAG TPA: cytochrome c [Anaerolineales bacterium]|nr:cytochrome c [Anaerolineales bacterium]